MPCPGHRTRYAAIRSWLDHCIGFPVNAEGPLIGFCTVNKFTYFGLRHEGGVQSARQLEEKNRSQSGATLLIIDDGSAKANLSPRDFSLVNLLRFQD